MTNVALQAQKHVFQESLTPMTRRSILSSRSTTNARSHKMRPVALIAFLTLASIFIAAKPASAESYPVCLAGEDNEPWCEYANLEQCQAAASGGLGECVTNTAFVSRAYASYNSTGKRHH
jgi:hypothetical protein